jgi:hypothetical protein
LIIGHGCPTVKDENSATWMMDRPSCNEQISISVGDIFNNIGITPLLY